MKNARLLSPHGVSDRNAPESAAIRRAEAIVKGDIRPALRNERRSREAFSMAFGPRGAVPGRSNTHATAVSPEGYAQGAHRERLTEEAPAPLLLRFAPDQERSLLGGT